MGIIEHLIAYWFETDDILSLMKSIVSVRDNVARYLSTSFYLTSTRLIGELPHTAGVALADSEDVLPFIAKYRSFEVPGDPEHLLT